MPLVLERLWASRFYVQKSSRLVASLCRSPVNKQSVGLSRVGRYTGWRPGRFQFVSLPASN